MTPNITKYKKSTEQTLFSFSTYFIWYLFIVGHISSWKCTHFMSRYKIRSFVPFYLCASVRESRTKPSEKKRKLVVFYFLLSAIPLGISISTENWHELTYDGISAEFDLLAQAKCNNFSRVFSLFWECALDCKSASKIVSPPIWMLKWLTKNCSSFNKSLFSDIILFTFAIAFSFWCWISCSILITDNNTSNMQREKISKKVDRIQNLQMNYSSIYTTERKKKKMSSFRSSLEKLGFQLPLVPGLSQKRKIT